MATMTATTAGVSDAEWVKATERRMYEAEVALHIARQTRVDAWIAAAAERLHLAIVANRVALAHVADH
jgi:hypothetical protein